MRNVLTKTFVADFLGVHRNTIARLVRNDQMKNMDAYIGLEAGSVLKYVEEWAREDERKKMKAELKRLSLL